MFIQSVLHLWMKCWERWKETERENREEKKENMIHFSILPFIFTVYNLRSLRCFLGVTFSPWNLCWCAPSLAWGRLGSGWGREQKRHHWSRPLRPFLLGSHIENPIEPVGKQLTIWDSLFRKNIEHLLKEELKDRPLGINIKQYLTLRQ